MYRGLTVEDLGKRSVRRNRLIADLLQRAGFVERVGSGFSRMEMALADNNNPPSNQEQEKPLPIVLATVNNILKTEIPEVPKWYEKQILPLEEVLDGGYVVII